MRFVRSTLILHVKHRDHPRHVPFAVGHVCRNVTVEQPLSGLIRNERQIVRRARCRIDRIHGHWCRQWVTVLVDQLEVHSVQVHGMVHRSDVDQVHEHLVANLRR